MRYDPPDHYPLQLEHDARITIVGWVKEGHPEDGCPAGRRCDQNQNQNQTHEEFRVDIDDWFIGQHRDQGAEVNAWLAVDPPWQTAGVVPAGRRTLRVAHLGEGEDAESVDYKLTVCAEALAAPTPTSTATSP